MQDPTSASEIETIRARPVPGLENPTRRAHFKNSNCKVDLMTFHWKGLFNTMSLIKNSFLLR